MKNQTGKAWWEVGWKNIYAPICPKESNSVDWVLLHWVFGFRKEMAGNADLLNGNLDKTSGRLISLIVTEIAPV